MRDNIWRWGQPYSCSLGFNESIDIGPQRMSGGGNKNLSRHSTTWISNLSLNAMKVRIILDLVQKYFRLISLKVNAGFINSVGRNLSKASSKTMQDISCWHHRLFFAFTYNTRWSSTKLNLVNQSRFERHNCFIIRHKKNNLNTIYNTGN